ncbi:MAG: potassium transporter [Cyclobacteriaceae bacterium]|nr:potassium transporter [Cyclobacteriaceae bacterium]
MARQIKDPGFGTKYASRTQRLINTDGTFNVKKTGIGTNIHDTYHKLINMSWTKFLFLSLMIIFLINVVFALVYVVIGVKHLQGNQGGDTLSNVQQAFYFSFQTFTTVGYGHIVPQGVVTNLVAFLESATGLMVFAIITGLLYGRFSKPSMRLLYSKNALIAPFEDGWAMMFRVTNIRKSLLIAMSANVAISIRDVLKGDEKRVYYRLPLRLSAIEFFPGSWTLVHPIDADSPFNKIDLHNLEKEDFEIIIQIKGFDETFGQTVHSHYSYIEEELVVGAKFRLAYEFDEKGQSYLPVDKFNDFDQVEFNGLNA